MTKNYDMSILDTHLKDMGYENDKEGLLACLERANDNIDFFSGIRSMIQLRLAESGYVREHTKAMVKDVVNDIKNNKYSLETTKLTVSEITYAEIKYALETEGKK